MPNRPEHLRAATPLGLELGVQRSNGRTGGSLLFFVGGSTIGGRVGAVLPDLFEPATSPRHRSFFHSTLMQAVLKELVTNPPAV